MASAPASMLSPEINTMSLAKLPFLATGLVATYILLSSPQPKVPSEKHSRDVTVYERYFSSAARSLVTIWRVLVSAPMLLEMIVIVASQYPSIPICQTILRALVNGPLSLTEHIALTPVFLVGWCLGILNTVLRYRCYRALGRFFTLELTTRDEQVLVTDGPYSYVRHPSYTTGVAGVAGFTLANLACGSWLVECAVLQTPAAQAVGALYVGVSVFNSVSLVWRTAGEDEMLRTHFGERWEIYAENVRYRLIPYVY